MTAEQLTSNDPEPGPGSLVQDDLGLHWWQRGS